MDWYKKTAVIVGASFIIATVTAIMTIGFLGTSLDPPGYFVAVAANEVNIVLAVIFWVILAGSVTVIGVFMFPILKKHHEGLAIGYVGLRLVESMCILISSIALLSLLSVSKEYVVFSGDVSIYQPVGTMLIALQEWSFLIGTLIFLGLGGLILYYQVYKLQLVPPWLSIWGFIGAGLVALYGVLGLFDLAVDATLLNILAAPIAVQEMVFAVWLIVKGFRLDALKG